MPFKDTNEGQTHYEGDNCGQESHNQIAYCEKCIQMTNRGISGECLKCESFLTKISVAQDNARIKQGISIFPSEYYQDANINIMPEEQKVRPHGENCGCPLTNERSPALGCPNPTAVLHIKPDQRGWIERIDDEFYNVVFEVIPFKAYSTALPKLKSFIREIEHQARVSEYKKLIRIAKGYMNYADYNNFISELNKGDEKTIYN